MSLFKEIDNMIIDKISEEFPVLTDAEKERIFAMSEKKYNMDNQEKDNVGFDDESEVRGVEQYNRPILSRITSIAAAAVILMAGISGGTAFIKFKKNNPATDQTKPTEAVSEIATKKEGKQDIASEYAEIAYKLTNRFAELENKYYNHALSVDIDDTLSFNVYNSDVPGKKATEKHYYRVTDADIQSGDDLKNEIKSLLTDEFYDRLFSVNSGEDYETLIIEPQYTYLFSNSDFDKDLSNYENNSDIDLADVNYHSLDFITYKGGFYVSTFHNPPVNSGSYSNYPNVVKIKKNGFSATLFANFKPFINTDKSQVGTNLQFDFVCEEGEWKINDIIIGRNMESAAAYAIKDYFINDCDDYDIKDLMITKDIFINDLEEDVKIFSYDDDNSCKVVCVIKDKYGNDFLEFQGNVVFKNDGFRYALANDRSGIELTDVSVTELQ